MPAVGFGLGLERLHASLVEQSVDLSPGEPKAVMVEGSTVTDLPGGGSARAPQWRGR